LPADGSAGAEEDRVVALLLHKLVNRHILADDGIADELDAHSF